MQRTSGQAFDPAAWLLPDVFATETPIQFTNTAQKPGARPEG
jgi:hypothetical protein